MADRRRGSLVSVGGSLGLVGAGLVLWWIGSTREWWDPANIPPPTDVARETADVVRHDPVFWSAFRATVLSVAATYAISILAGFAVAFVFWRLPLVGRILEPVTVALYSVPFIVFYPVTLVLFGVTPGSIVALASVLSMVPMLLNSWIGLRAVPAVIYKLGESYHLSLWTFTRKLAVPHAVPQLFAGLRLSLVFAIISVTAMEFLMYPRGLGFEARYAYQSFDQLRMLAYIAVIFVVAIIATVGVRTAELALAKGRV